MVEELLAMDKTNRVDREFKFCGHSMSLEDRRQWSSRSSIQGRTNCHRQLTLRTDKYLDEALEEAQGQPWQCCHLL